MSAIESFKNPITNSPKENSPMQTEALDLMINNSKGGHGCARPSEPNTLDFGSLLKGAGAIASGVTSGDKADHVDGKKIDTDNLTVHHHKDHGCALPSNPDLLDFDALGNGGGKGDKVDGKNPDDDALTVKHHNPDVPLLKDPVQKQPPHELDGVCFTPNFDKQQQLPKILPAPAWAPSLKN